MTVLLIADHDNKSLKDATRKALAAAAKMGDDVHVLVQGQQCEGLSKAAANLSGVTTVLQF